MIRTQISLSAQDYGLAKDQASQLGISLAELLRRALHSILTPRREKPWMKYAGDIDAGHPTSNEEIDEIVYGQKD